MSLAYAKPRIVERRQLLPHHCAELQSSAIDPTAAGLSGVSSCTHGVAYDLGMRSVGALEGLLFRYYEPWTGRFSSRFARLKPDVQIAGRKYLQPVGERPRLYFPSSTTAADLADPDVPAFLVEGEKKALSMATALSRLGIRALVFGLGGVWAWRYSPKKLQPDGSLGRGRSRPIEDLDLITWIGRRVFICLDSDAASNWKVNVAEVALGRETNRRGAVVSTMRIVASSSGTKVGVDDLIAARGPTVVQSLMEDAWPFDDQPRPEPVHLSDIESAALGRKRLVIDLMVSAVGDTYLIPQTIEVQCLSLVKAKKKSRLRLVQDEESTPADATLLGEFGRCAHLGVDEGRWKLEVRSPELLIDLTRVPSRALHKRLLEWANGLCANAGRVRIRSHQTVSSFLATPRTRRLRTRGRDGRGEVLDETGRPFREKVVFCLDRVSQASRCYRGVGVAVPNPKSQEATAFFWDLRPSEQDWERFQLSRPLMDAFRGLQSGAGGAWEKLKAVAHDLTLHRTNIYGRHRELALLGKLLVFHSVRHFRFDGELLKRGWLEMIEIGDTGQGKTQQVDRLVDATGLGESIDGVSTTRTGLAYSYQKHNDAWFLVWGKYPLNDGRLLFVDEAQNLNPDDIDKIRKGRSDGVIAAAGIRSGEHPTRTRLIMTANPRFQGVVDDELFGIELLKQTFKDEDIRRFDFAIISSSSDEKAGINEHRERVQGEPLVTDDLLRESVRWAWSRKADEVEFTPEATTAVYVMAQSLTATYGEARDIPLVLESDIRHKVARIATAAAALLHSTDADHRVVIVTEEHVALVGDFLTSVYTHPNASFETYARMRKGEAALSDDEYESLRSQLRACQVQDGVPLSGDARDSLLRAFVTHGGQISRQDLAGEMGVSPAWASKVVRVLKVNRLIRVNRGRTGGYRATPKFSRFLKMAIQKGDLEG